MWEDIVLGTAIWVLLAALIPTIVSKTKKPTFLTAITTGTALLAITSAYVSLGFWWSAVPSSFIAGAWFIIAYQRYRLDAKEGGR